MKTYKISGATLRGFTVNWSGSLLTWIMRADPLTVSSDPKVIIKKPLKWPEYPLFFLTFSNPVYSDGSIQMPSHVRSFKKKTN